MESRARGPDLGYLGGGGLRVTTLVFWLTRHKNVPLILPLLVSLAGALAAPVTWLATRVAPTAEVTVISQSASLLLQHGTPYLPAGQLDTVLSYNPYLPVMAVFGMPKALGREGPVRRPAGVADRGVHRLDLGAFTVAAPHRHCDSCRYNVLMSTVFIAASPVIAFPLAVGITDPPVIALDVPHPGADRQAVGADRGPPPPSASRPL